MNVSIPIGENLLKISSTIETYQNITTLYNELKKVEEKDVMWKLSVLRDYIVGFYDLGVEIFKLRDDIITLFQYMREYDEELVKNINVAINADPDSELAVIVTDDINQYNKILDQIQDDLKDVKIISVATAENLKKIVVAIIKINKNTPNINNTKLENKICIGMYRLLDAFFERVMNIIYRYIHDGCVMFNIPEDKIC